MNVCIVILTIVYGPHAACTSARLLPSEPRGLRQGSVGQRDGDPGPPGHTDGICTDIIRSESSTSQGGRARLKGLILTRCSCRRSRRCCEVGGVQHRAPADTRCGAETRSDPGWWKTPDSRCKNKRTSHLNMFVLRMHDFYI